MLRRCYWLASQWRGRMSIEMLHDPLPRRSPGWRLGTYRGGLL